MSTLTIDHCGPLATIQDVGRHGWQHCGVTTGGAIDDAAYRLGQRLVDNPTHAAAIELPWGDLRLRLSDSRRVAVTGAPLPLTVDGQPQSMQTGFELPANTELALGRSDHGVWTYISISGGIDTPPVLGSRATVLREKLGGLEGRALRPGDQLPLGENPPGCCRYKSGSLNAPSDVTVLRYVPCMHDDLLSRDSRDALQSQVFTLSSRSDRMGARLESEPLTSGIEQLWSEATCLGAMQIPPDGQPIVLLNDRQTMGGYPMAGVLARVDCARLAQLRPGARVRLEPISLAGADRLHWLQDNYERELVLPAIAGDGARG